jgi:hypothetical protein
VGVLAKPYGAAARGDDFAFKPPKNSPIPWDREAWANAHAVALNEGAIGGTLAEAA